MLLAVVSMLCVVQIYAVIIDANVPISDISGSLTAQCFRIC